MDLGLDGKRALVFGSSDGLGREIAARLTGEGVRVVVTGRDPDKVARTADELRAAGRVVADLTDDGAAEQVVDQTISELGGLDVLVVNTGGGKPGGILDTDQAQTDAAYRAMLRPALAAARAGAPHLRESGAGSLVFSTARSVLEATPELALSSVFRSGVAAAARSLAIELAPAVRVNVVVPGQFDTGAYRRFVDWESGHEGEARDEVRERHLREIPLGRLGLTGELADVVAFLCSDRAGFVTGSVVRVDGGAVRGF